MSRRGPREIELVVERLESDGCGQGVFETQAGLHREILAKNALPGEHLEVVVLKRRGSIWQGEARTPEAEISPMRVTPACGYYPRCGGCAMQHLEYQQQLELKQRQLLDALAVVGVEPLRLAPPVYGPRLGYRTKARLGVRQLGEQILIGFRETFSNRIARMDSCETLIPEFSRLIAPLKGLIGSMHRPERIPQIELAAGDSACALVIRHLDPLTPEDRALCSNFAVTHQVEIFLQGGGYDTVEPCNESRSPYLGYSNMDFGLHFHFLPWDFTQVNLRMNRLLVQAALNCFGKPSGERMFDLFCGIGNFSLAAAASGWQVVGLEAAAASVERARMNAELNGLGDRCEFRLADLYHPGTELSGRADCLLLDPPRSGAGPNLPRWIETLQPSKLVYVSCQPRTFAEDAAVLQRSGYQLEQVGIFDMFPNTAHVETLGSFSRTW